MTPLRTAELKTDSEEFPTQIKWKGYSGSRHSVTKLWKRDINEAGFPGKVGHRAAVGIGVWGATAVLLGRELVSQTRARAVVGGENTKNARGILISGCSWAKSYLLMTGDPFIDFDGTHVFGLKLV